MHSCVSECCMDGPQSDSATARGVGKPRITHIDEEIHACAHGLVRVGVRRHGVVIGAELVRRVIGGHAHVILLAGLQDARAELVEPGVILRRFDLINKLPIVIRDNILLPAGVLAKPEDVHVKRHVAVGDGQHKIGEPRLRPAIGEFEPLKALEHCLVGIFAGGGRVRPFVVTAINGLPELEGLGGLPSIVGCSGDDAGLLIRGVGRPGSRRLGNGAQRCPHIRHAHFCGS